MKEYLELVDYVLKNGVRKENRTGVATISTFAYSYKVDLNKGYPLLSTKKVFFNSMLHELFWYLSGEEHIKNLEEKDHLSNLLKSGMASCPSAVHDEKRREEPGRFEST